ncbi:MAG: DUF1559 domain-containing protein [Pirellulales bacterium]|nr:DUF1559 domain-containing protein [Pirellulales bacterium]
MSDQPACPACGEPACSPSAAPAEPVKKRSCGCWTVFFALLGIGVLVALLLPSVETAREAAGRAQCMNNLKQLALALHIYESEHGQFPPAYVADNDGKPMYGWRVLILPYLEQSDLYEEFKLDEPWDSPHNLAVAKESCPTVFRCPSVPTRGPNDDPSSTNYAMIVGPGCFSEGTTSADLKSIRHTDQMIMLVEVADSGILWTEPRDLDATTMSYQINDPDKPGISSAHPDGANAAFVDGHVHFLGNELRPELVRKMTRVDAELTDEEKENW